jgi:serine phosphatase RsbU (regulator of sigma subunit)/Tfp pilus assembly protein PilF
MMKIFGLILSFIFLNGFIVGQTSAIDSIRNLILHSKNDSLLVFHYYDLGIELFEFSQDDAFLSVKKGIEVCEKRSDFYMAAEGYGLLGQGYFSIRSLVEASDAFEKSLHYFQKSDSLVHCAIIYNNLGMVYATIGDYKKSLKLYNKSLEIHKSSNNTFEHIKALINIGMVYSDWSDYDKAIEYHKEAFAMLHKVEFSDLNPTIYNNLGMLYSEKGDNKKALANYKMAVEQYRKIISPDGLATTFSNIGLIYWDMDIADSAYHYYTKSLEIFEKINNRENICWLKGHLGHFYLKAGEFGLAISYFEECYFESKKNNFIEPLLYSMDGLAKGYYKAKDFNLALNMLKEYEKLKDETFDNESREYIEEMNIKYELEKKELSIIRKKAIIQKQKIENERKKERNNYLLAAIFVFFGIAIYTITIFLKKKKSNNILKLRNQEINLQKEEIFSQLEMVANQRDLINLQKSEMIRSIEFAYVIQSAIIPDENILKEIIKDYFIIYKPRDIVSGDFYWMEKIDDKIVIIAADCTGHGVPGAFMSMLGIAFLNEIVKKDNITKPDLILNRLRELLIEVLNKHSYNNEMEKTIKDGMDMAALTIDYSNMKLNFSGANNPIYLIHKVSNGEKDFREIKGDKMPVGYYFNMEKFSNHEIKVSGGDKIYLFSDGFADQFGGPKGKKFKYSQFKELLTSVVNLPMAQQKETIEKTYHQWKGTIEQLDDVLVMGIEI